MHNPNSLGGAQPATDDPEEDMDYDPTTVKGNLKPSFKRKFVSARQWFRYNIMVRFKLFLYTLIDYNIREKSIKLKIIFIFSFS